MKDKIAIYLDDVGICGIHVPVEDATAEQIVDRFLHLRRVRDQIQIFDQLLKQKENQ